MKLSESRLFGLLSHSRLLKYSFPFQGFDDLCSNVTVDIKPSQLNIFSRCPHHENARK